jgi:hypothetical protein
MTEVTNFLRRPQISIIPKESRYQKLGLIQNPFPNKQSLIVGSSDPRENGSIYLPDIRLQEQQRFEELMIPNPDRTQARSLGLLMDYATRRGRGIGKTAFLNYQRQRIMKDYGNSLSAGTHVIFATHILPEASKQRKFWQFAQLIAETLNEQEIIAQAIWRIRAFSGIIPDNVLNEIGEEPQNTIGNDQWLGDKKINVLFELSRQVQKILEKSGIRPELAEPLASFGHSPGLFRRNFLAHQSDYRWRRDGGQIVFDDFIRLFIAAGFTRGLFLVDELEKIVPYQSTLERRMFIDSIRYFFIDGLCENTRQSFLGLFLTIHPYLQELLTPHWEAAGLNRFCALGGELAKEYTVYFKPLTQESAEPLVKCYLDRFRVPDEIKGTLIPFDKSAVEEALIRSGGVPGPMLRLLYFVIEKAINSEWSNIGASQIREVLQEQPPQEPDEVEIDQTLPPTKVDLMGEGEK